MSIRIVSRIKDMGQDFQVSIEQIDEFVDACINFLIREQADCQGTNFSSDIFDIEQARQDALVSKFSLTIQPYIT